MKSLAQINERISEIKIKQFTRLFKDKHDIESIKLNVERKALEWVTQ